MISKFKNNEARKSALIYLSNFEQVKELYLPVVLLLLGELGIQKLLLGKKINICGAVRR